MDNESAAIQLLSMTNVFQQFQLSFLFFEIHCPLEIGAPRVFFCPFLFDQVANDIQILKSLVLVDQFCLAFNMMGKRGDAINFGAVASPAPYARINSVRRSLVLRYTMRWWGRMVVGSITDDSQVVG